MRDALREQWDGRLAVLAPIAVDLTFCIWPDSPAYGGQNRPHGTDLDNMIKVTIDGLTPHEGRGVGIIQDDRCVYQIVARKEQVRADADAGAWIEVSQMA
jgi:Holliday junction resolvase RusA-like endonuclease